MTIQHIDLMPRLSLILRPAFLWLTDCHRYRTLLLRSTKKLQIPRLPPGFPGKIGGVGALPAAFLIESRIRGCLWHRAVGNPGYARDDKG